MATLRRIREQQKYFMISGQPQNSGSEIRSRSGLKKRTKTRLKTFVDRTTIPGLVKVATGSSKLSKLLWILALFGGTFFAVWESHYLIRDYRAMKVIQVNDWDYPSVFEFPSVTVCTHNPIEWQRALLENNSIVTSLQKVYDESDEKTYDFGEEIEKRVMEKLLFVPENVRFNWGTQRDEFIMECKWENADCKEQLYQSNNPFYGNCFTFNPRFDGHQEVMGNRLSVLSILVRVNFAERFSPMTRDEGPAVAIHPSGTAPVMHISSAIVIYPGHKATIPMRKNIIERLPAPYPSNCVDHLDRSIRNRSYYFLPFRPYWYSSEACMISCIQRIHIKECQCIHQARYPLPPWLRAHQNLTLPLCDLIKGCELGQSIPVPVDKCPCPSPCREVNYDYELKWDKKWLTQKRFHPLISRYTNTSRGFGEDLVSLEILFSPASYIQMSREEPAVTAQFFSNIGGNLGLCLGVSLLSFMEVFEFLLQLLNDCYAYVRFKASRARLPILLTRLIAKMNS